MAKTKQKSQKEGPDKVAAAVTGAVVGAGLAVAGVVAMKEENREKMKDALNKTKDRAGDYVEELQRQAKIKQYELENKISEGKEEAGKTVKKLTESTKSKPKSKA